MGFYKVYIRQVQRIIDRVLSEQSSNIESAAKIIAEAITTGHAVFAFGCSHAGILTEELFYRTGGLAVINPIFNPTLMLNTRPVTLTSHMERLEGLGMVIIDDSPVAEGDVLLIHSVSGRNSVNIDAAMTGKKKGAYVIALTNMTYSKQVASRHSSGKNLYQVADLVIDNCGDFEDSAVTIGGLNQKVGPTSTAVGALIINAIVTETVGILVERGVSPPVFRSANVDGGDEANRRIFEEYGDRIHYL